MLFSPTMPTVGPAAGSARGGLATFSSPDSSSSSVVAREPEPLLLLRMPKQDIFWLSLTSAMRSLADAAGAVTRGAVTSVLTGAVSERPEG